MTLPAQRCIRYFAMICEELGETDLRDETVERWAHVRATAANGKKAEDLAVRKLADRALAAMIEVPALYRAISSRYAS